ncbi:MAG: ubiquinol-cytochrome C chaperone family protein [Rhodospirillales bacterium]
MSFIFRSRHERAGFVLYSEAVRAAREPVWFEAVGVPDSLDGRFDLVGLFAALLIRRLRSLPPPGAALAQAVFDAMFADMDFNLRELGVSDLSVGKRVRAMWEAFHGRALAYEGPLERGDAEALAAALARNVWRGQAPAGAAEQLARVALLQDRHLAGIGVAAFQAGGAAFLPAASVLAPSVQAPPVLE